MLRNGSLRFLLKSDSHFSSLAVSFADVSIFFWIDFASSRSGSALSLEHDDSSAIKRASFFCIIEILRQVTQHVNPKLRKKNFVNDDRSHDFGTCRALCREGDRFFLCLGISLFFTVNRHRMSLRSVFKPVQVPAPALPACSPSFLHRINHLVSTTAPAGCKRRQGAAAPCVYFFITSE